MSHFKAQMHLNRFLLRTPDLTEELITLPQNQ